MNKELSEERWKPVVGYEKQYRVSSLSRVKSIDRKRKLILSPGLNKRYLFVSLTKNKKHKPKRIHRLVAEAFIPNPQKYRIVNHKNGIKTDNRIENLEWCTYSENLTHAYKNNLRFNKKAILQLDLKDNYIKEHSSLSDASKSIDKYYGRGNITKCCKGLRKSAYGYKWEYIN